MSQYGQVSGNYYLPKPKFNTLRDNIRYIALFYGLNNRILYFCTYQMPPLTESAPFDFGLIGDKCNLAMPAINPYQYLYDSYPFTFAAITNFCRSSNLNIPVEYADYFLANIPLDLSVTGNCLANVQVNQTEYNVTLGVVSSPQAFSFDNTTGSCIINLSEGVALNYTPITPSAALTGLFAQVISNNCSYQMPVNPFSYHITSTPFDFVTLTNFCLATNLNIPIEYTDYSVPTIPLDLSVTGNCLVDVQVNQTEYNLTIGNIVNISNPLPFSFGSVTGSCEDLIEMSDIEDFYLTVGLYVPQVFNFGTISNSCIANISS